MFKVLVLQTLDTLADDPTEYQLKDRLSFLRFLGLALHDPVPDAKTIWLFRAQLTRAGAIEHLFARFDAALRDAGDLAMGGQIVEATVVEARRPRLTGDEKATVKSGGVPAGWSPAKRAQMATDGRWTIKRGRRRPPRRGERRERVTTAIAVPVFGYKNHVGIDRRHGFIRSFAATDAARHDSRQLDQLLDPHNTASPVWADVAYRSAAKVALLARRGLVPQFQRPKPRGQPLPPHLTRGYAARARVRVAIEHVFAAQKCRLGLVIRSIGLARAKLSSGSPTWSPTCAAWSGSRPARRRPDPHPKGTIPRPAPATAAIGPSLAASHPHSHKSPHKTRFFEVSWCTPPAWRACPSSSRGGEFGDHDPHGHPGIRLARHPVAGPAGALVPMLFILGFLFIFTIGGLTGVMVAAVPYDWQVHDTYFVVAHFHYVLIGGMVFPLFAAFYYWIPFVTRRLMSERLGHAAFWLMFIGFNFGFLPMHVTGLRGMPRHVYTYPEGLGWDWLNLVATIGAFLFAAGVLVFLTDLILHRRMGRPAGHDPWNAPSLEWLSAGKEYGFRSLVPVRSRYPLWEVEGIDQEIEAGRGYLPDAPTREREALVTGPITAEPEQIIRLPGPGWTPFVAAAATAVLFTALTLKHMPTALGAGLIAVAAYLYWFWTMDKAVPPEPADAGRGLALPLYRNDHESLGWWGMVVLLIADAAIVASFVFAYLFLWTVRPMPWPPDGSEMPGLLGPSLILAALVGAYVLFEAAERYNRRGDRFAASLCLGACAIAAVLALGLDWRWLQDLGIDPTRHGYGARGGFSIVQASGRLPLSTSRQRIGAATRNPARARGDQAPIAVVPRPFLK